MYIHICIIIIQLNTYTSHALLEENSGFVDEVEAVYRCLVNGQTMQHGLPLVAAESHTHPHVHGPIPPAPTHTRHKHSEIKYAAL